MAEKRKREGVGIHGQEYGSAEAAWQVAELQARVAELTSQVAELRAREEGWLRGMAALANQVDQLTLGKVWDAERLGESVFEWSSRIDGMLMDLTAAIGNLEAKFVQGEGGDRSG